MVPSADIVLLKVRAGEIAESGSWVYVWCRMAGDPGVVYVGGTGLDPATRAWLHLNDPVPAVGRLVALLPSARSEAFDVVALRLSPGVSRNEVKAATIALLSEKGLLSADYTGDPPLPVASAAPDVIEPAERLARKVTEHLHDPA